jgi:hypothetical protein
MKTIRYALLLCATTLSGLAHAQTVQPTVKPLALSAAEDYAQLARYPQWSTVLEAGATDPMLADRMPSRQTILGPNGAGPRLTVWASTISALPGETVTLYAALASTATGLRSLAEGVGTAQSAVSGARVSAELITQDMGSLGTVTYLDDGVAPDARAGDGIYVARFTLPSDKTPALGQAESVMVKVTAVLANEERRQIAGGFQFSNPAARLTGRYTDVVRDGNLVIAAELDVLAPGRVYLSGTLADVADLPFATAQAAQVLQPGKQWMELSFYGLAFHDRAITGGVKLASVAATSTNGMPNALGPVASNAHVTKAYSLGQFTRASFNEPSLMEAARRLQIDAGIQLAPALQ